MEIIKDEEWEELPAKKYNGVLIEQLDRLKKQLDKMPNEKYMNPEEKMLLNSFKETEKN